MKAYAYTPLLDIIMASNGDSTNKWIDIKAVKKATELPIISCSRIVNAYYDSPVSCSVTADLELEAKLLAAGQCHYNEYFGKWVDTSNITPGTGSPDQAAVGRQAYYPRANDIVPFGVLWSANSDTPNIMDFFGTLDEAKRFAESKAITGSMVRVFLELDNVTCRTAYDWASVSKDAR